MKAKTTQQLEKERAVLSNEIYRRETAERIRDARKDIGKCFRYLNSYSDGEKWYLYARIVDVSEHGWRIANTFQHTSADIVEFELSRAMSFQLSRDWEPISTDEFRKNYRIVLCEVRKKFTEKV